MRVYRVQFCRLTDACVSITRIRTVVEWNCREQKKKNSSALIYIYTQQVQGAWSRGYAYVFHSIAHCNGWEWKQERKKHQHLQWDPKGDQKWILYNFEIGKKSDTRERKTSSPLWMCGFILENVLRIDEWRPVLQNRGHLFILLYVSNVIFYSSQSYNNLVATVFHSVPIASTGCVCISFGWILLHKNRAHTIVGFQNLTDIWQVSHQFVL